MDSKGPRLPGSMAQEIFCSEIVVWDGKVARPTRDPIYRRRPPDPAIVCVVRLIEACQSGNASAASEAAAADRLPSAKSAHNPGMNFAVAPPGPLASVVS